MLPTRPASHRLRKGRFSEPNRIYLVTCATHQRQPLFRDWHCGANLARNLNRQEGTTTLAYVVMPDHYHWLMKLDGQWSLSKAVQTVNSVTAHHINHYLGRRGRLWQGGFHDHAVRREENLQAIARYLAANPLRAGLVEKLGDYPFWGAVWL